MGVDGVGYTVPVKEVEQPKVEPLKTENTEPQKLQAPLDNTATIGNFAFNGAVTKESLNRTLDAKVEAETKPADTPPTKEIDYFEIDKQADELIKKHTDDGFFSDSLKTDDLGKELAEIAKKEPEKAAALTDNILDKIKGSDKDEVAQSMVEAMSPEELREFAKNEKGKEILEQLKDHLLSGSVWDDERDTAKRIDTAIKSAELEKSPEFQKLDKGVQTEILNRLEKNEKNPAAVDNLLNLVKDKAFLALPPETQKAMLTALDNRPEDTVFVDSMRALAAEPRFTALTTAQQAGVIKDMDTFAKTESYKGKDGFIFGIGGRDVSPEDQRYLLDTIGDVSIYSAENPGLKAVRNTLDKVINGDIKFNAFNEPATDGFITYGYADGNTITLNRHADAARGIEGVVDTLVHEVNHILNGNTEAGTPERFLDEFRAWVAGIEASGQTIDAQTLRDILDNLGHSDGGAYDHLRELYNNNADYRAVIDEVYAGLNETPPVLIDAEQMRQRLLDAGFDSEYLRTTGNLDNR